jgi:catechol 2,3-dioxygenase-like lactoylglutathione lyase family enzyme
VASPVGVPGIGGEIVTAHASMNHVAFDVPAERMEDYRERLVAKGVNVSIVINHDNSPKQISREWTDDVFVRSMYFMDPDGILLEFASWTKVFDESDVSHKPARAVDAKEYARV